MSDTLPDVPVSGSEYVDVYTLSGITVGTRIVIQNKTQFPIHIQETAAQPLAASTDGIVCDRLNSKIVISASGCWVKARTDSKISVQPV